MHLRIKNDFTSETLKLDFQQSTNSKILKSEQNFMQSFQTQICPEILLECKTDRSFSPKTKRNQKRYLTKSQQIWFNEDDQEFEEYSIWGDCEQLPVGNNKENTLISFLELYKYRYERTTKRPVSSYNVIQITKRLINRHSTSKIKYFGINKLQWIDFRDWSK
ncbi:unnamed protein product [Paramecium pentaurelia]|uniref:Uncharacterized protein n=1 Tax=Paramecium pentaurelia TaxID=43138 RepID=A0A8S1VTA4_9CILI|nr:unnamed protein product [Paramecium pentaurelia]